MRLPWPLVWIGVVLLVTTVLLLTAYGHLTLQWTVIVAALWASAYLVRSPVPRAQLLTSLIVAAGMTVWLPMNAIAAVLVVGWLVVLVARVIREGRAGADWVGLDIVVVVSAVIGEPLRSSVAFVLASAPTAGGALETVGEALAAASGRLWALAPALSPVWAGLTESTLFEAGGGTEQDHRDPRGSGCRKRLWQQRWWSRGSGPVAAT